MISLFISLAVLVIGYLVYGKVTNKIFAPDDRETPAVAINDGVDCVPMKTWKAFLIQLLNIAGTGPIFGALMGAVFGPVVFLWIVFGSLLTAFPAAFMTAVCITYLLTAPEGFRINYTVSCIIGLAASLALFTVYLIALLRSTKQRSLQ